MQIDWITVLAQIANFLVLVWLLRRFLYAPITRAMAQREQRIADRLAAEDVGTDQDAVVAAREAAEAEAETLRAERKALEDSRQGVLDDAAAEAAAMRARLERDLQDEIEDRRRAWRESLEHERGEVATAIEMRAGQEVIEILRQILRDFAAADLAEQVADEFIRRLEALDSEARARLSDAARHADEPALVESSLALPPPVQGRITRAIHETLAPGIAVDHATSDEIVLGIRLTLGGHVVEWSASRHLARLQTALTEALEAATPVAEGRTG